MVTTTDDTDLRALAVAALEAHCAEHGLGVQEGAVYPFLHCWVRSDDISARTLAAVGWPDVQAGLSYLDRGAFRGALRRAASAGLCAATPPGRRGGRWTFTTNEIAAAIERETALSDLERAERSAAMIRREYDEEVRRSPEDPRLWPRDTRGWYTDGLQPAVDAGLLVHVRDDRWSGTRRFVPAEHHAAYVDALALYERNEARALALARYEAARDRLLAIAGPSSGRGRRVELTVDQVERLLAAIGDQP